MKVLFFAPVFNQARELPRVLAEFRAAALSGVELLLVNNGSSDGSETMVRESGHPYIDLSQNRGAGYGYEVPVTTRYPETGRYSKIRPGRDWYAMLVPWLRARLDPWGFRPA